jgi:hypothetical protein
MCATTLAAKSAEDSVKWRFDAKSHVWASPETGIALRRSIAGFQQQSAEPYDKDGSAFGYFGKHGALTLIIERRAAGGYPGTGDCTPQSRANYLEQMHEKYGKTDSERSFGLAYSSGGKSGRGVGTLCHFVSFPTFDGLPAYSEVGVVLIGDILLEYRYSYANPAGAADLDAFLRALGVKKV